MKLSLRKTETRQLEKALFNDINIINAIRHGVDPITCVILKIPPTVTIDTFIECLKKADAESYRCFTSVIESYYQGVMLSDPCYPPMKRIFATIGSYHEIPDLRFDGDVSIDQPTGS